MKKYFVVVFLVLLFALSGPAFPAEKDGVSIAFSFLGSYKKTMLSMGELREYVKKYEKKYKVEDLEILVLVVAMYESGGNDLTSSAGAKGVMQVMPKTQEFMGVKSTNEAGVKYLAHLLSQFGKYYSGSVLRSKVIQAYNGGPGRVEKGLVRIETFQYLQGVSLYYNLFREHKEKIERLSQDLEVKILKQPQSWEELSDELEVSVCELRIYNPFLSHFFKEGKIPKGKAVVYPREGANLFFETSIDSQGRQRFFYITRQGDIIHHLANIFGYDYEKIRKKTNMLLWSVLYAGKKIDITDSPYLAKD